VRALDIGCSQGILELLLSRKNIKVVGIDINPGSIYFARKLLENEPEKVKGYAVFQQCDFRVEDLSETDFDTVYLGEVIEHLSDPGPFIRKAVDKMKDGGRLVITTPHGFLPHEDHYHAFGLDELLALLPDSISIVNLDVVDGYIRMVGEKADSNQKNRPSASELLQISNRSFIQQQKTFYNLLTQKSSRYAERDAKLKKQIDNLKTQIDNLKTQIDNLKTHVKNLTNEKAVLADELKTLRESIIYNAGKIIWNSRKSFRSFILTPYRLFKLLKKSRSKNGSQDKNKQTLYLPIPNYTIDSEKVTIGAILDEFSAKAFAYEANLMRFKPDNWRGVLARYCMDIVLVESAWNGNDGSWQYRIASYKKKFGDELQNMLDYCKSQDIPTVFWNKEDPVHYDRFIDNARQFDYIFTTDEGCISKYRESLPHKNIFSLPFAAQPRLNNPMLDESRNKKVCFAGSYYASRHDQRRKDMEIILQPATEFDLDIWDRNYGVQHSSADQFAFPEIYQQFIRGRLEFCDMVKAYRKYRVFLNVNSVTQSKTMFSRRVFELLASGTPVVSSYSAGIVEQLGEDTVLLSDNPATTKEHLNILLNDDTFWWKKSVKGIRTVFDKHSYGHRLAAILADINFRKCTYKKVQACAVTPISSELDAERIITTIKRQHTLPVHMIVHLASSDLGDAFRRIVSALPAINIKKTINSEKYISEIRNTLNSIPFDFVVFMNPNHLYSDYFIEDISIFPRFLSKFIVLQASRFEFRQDGTVHPLGAGLEYQRLTKGPTAGMAISSESLSNERIRIAMEKKNLVGKDWPIVSMHPFGMVTSASGKPVPEEENVRKFLKV
jgi:2-polyprenyl-3-methyl-5-hydroxy-6-metoxy-1,4-benzoquinol methylase/spore maturation protein CgeB